MHYTWRHISSTNQVWAHFPYWRYSVDSNWRSFWVQSFHKLLIRTYILAVGASRKIYYCENHIISELWTGWKALATAKWADWAASAPSIQPFWADFTRALYVGLIGFFIFTRYYINAGIVCRSQSLGSEAVLDENLNEICQKYNYVELPDVTHYQGNAHCCHGFTVLYSWSFSHLQSSP